MPSALESVNFSFIRILAGLQHGVFVLALEDPVCHRVHCDVVRGRKRQKMGGLAAISSQLFMLSFPHHTATLPC